MFLLPLNEGEYRGWFIHYFRTIMAKLESHCNGGVSFKTTMSLDSNTTIQGLVVYEKSIKFRDYDLTFHKKNSITKSAVL